MNKYLVYDKFEKDYWIVEEIGVNRISVSNGDAFYYKDKSLEAQLDIDSLCFQEPQFYIETDVDRIDAFLVMNELTDREEFSID